MKKPVYVVLYKIREEDNSYNKGFVVCPDKEAAQSCIVSLQQNNEIDGLSVIKGKEMSLYL